MLYERWRKSAWLRSRFYALHQTIEAHRQLLSDTIHASVIEHLAYPADKRFHRFLSLNQADFIFPLDRSSNYIIVELSMFEGRSVETKKRLIRSLICNISERTGIEPQGIEITIFETPKHAWGIRGKPGDELVLNYKVDIDLGGRSSA